MQAYTMHGKHGSLVRRFLIRSVFDIGDDAEEELCVRAT